MTPTKQRKLRDLCVCGHELSDHEDCECPKCPDGSHGCWEKIRKGNNNDFCDCDGYRPIKSKGGGEMSKEDRFYDLKSALTSALIDFIKICEENERDTEDEIDDCIADAEKEAK